MLLKLQRRLVSHVKLAKTCVCSKDDLQPRLPARSGTIRYNKIANWKWKEMFVICTSDSSHCRLIRMDRHLTAWRRTMRIVCRLPVCLTVCCFSAKHNNNNDDNDSRFV